MKRVTDINKKIPRAPLYVSSLRTSRGMARFLLGLEKRLATAFFSLLTFVFFAHGFIAFEAHVVHVEAEIAQVDPPVINHAGGVFQEPVEVMIKSSDPDVSFVYYMILPGDNPDAVQDPSCASDFGGTNPQGPITISRTSVAKAVACVGDTPESPHGPVTTEIYRFVEQEGGSSVPESADMDKGEDIDDPVDEEENEEQENTDENSMDKEENEELVENAEEDFEAEVESESTEVEENTAADEQVEESETQTESEQELGTDSEDELGEDES